MPVLPLVGSMIVPLGRNAPSRSACSIMARQMRSFTLPPGLSDSSFAQTSARRPSSWGRRDRRTTGVEPIKSSAVRATWQGSGMNALCAGGAGEHIRRVREGSIQEPMPELVMIFPGALGDFLLALPTFRLLRHRHHGARTTLVVGGPLRELARLSGLAEQSASMDDASTAWLFGGTTMPPWLAGRPAVYSWLGRDRTLGDRPALVAASVRLLGVERGPGPEHASLAYARAAAVPARPAELAAHARIARPPSPRARALLGGLARPVLAIHRGAGSPAKRWGRDGYAALVDGWRRTAGSVIELLGPAEALDAPLAGAVPARH